MRKRSPTERTDKEPPSKTSAVHGYRTLRKGSLGLDDEAQIGRTIQEGNAALSQLGDAIAQAVKRHLTTVDMRPVKPKTLETLIIGAVGEALIRHAKHQGDDHAKALQTGIHGALSDLLAAEDVLQGQDAERWLSQRLPYDVLAQLISPVLFKADAPLEAIRCRERAIGELVEWHLPLAKPIAKGAMRQPFEFDDLMNEAALILRHVAERFDPASGNRFSSYAKVALKRDLWRRSPTHIGLTRHSRDQVQEVKQLERKLSHEQGHSVTIDEVYERLAIPERTRGEIENVRRILKARRQLHAYPPRSNADLRDLQLPDPFSAASKKEDSQRLLAAFRKLSLLERGLIVGHCVRGLSFRELGKRLRKSPKTVSDMCKDSLQKLADLLDPNRPIRKPK